jgi:hypothetical protein
MEQNLNFVSFILLVKAKCNRHHFYGLNWVLANIVKKFKIHYMVIRFLSYIRFWSCKIQSYKKKKTSHGDFSIGCGIQLA